MTRIVFNEKDGKSITMMEGDAVTLLAGLTTICKSLSNEGITEEMIRYAFDLAFEKNKSEKDAKDEFKEELDNAMKKVIEMLIKNSSKG